MIGQHPPQFSQQPGRDTESTLKKLKLHWHPIEDLLLFSGSILPSSHSVPRQNHGHVNGNKTEKSGEIIHHFPGPQGNFWRDNEGMLQRAALTTYCWVSFITGWAPQSGNPTPRQDYGSHNGNTFNTSTPNSNRYQHERSNEGMLLK